LNTSAQLSFQVESKLTHLEEVLSNFESLKRQWIPSKVWLQCQLALAEGFTNAVRHAHGDKPSDTPIKIQINLNSEEIIIRIWDYGKYFQLDDICLCEDENSQRDGIGGRGIRIMQQIANELSYERFPDSRNCLVIKKNIFDA
jgi:serine/threonine-protein kinase RsbW